MVADGIGLTPTLTFIIASDQAIATNINDLQLSFAGATAYGGANGGLTAEIATSVTNTRPTAARCPRKRSAGTTWLPKR